MKKIIFVLLLLNISLTTFAFTPIEWNNKEFMAVSEIKPGMTGYGLTVYQGQKIEKFNIKVISVLANTGLGLDMIIIEITSGSVKTKGWQSVAGMSGSPIYINNRLIGAYAYGWDFQNEPIAGVTPIASMIGDTSTIPQSATSDKLAIPVKIGEKSYDRLAIGESSLSMGIESASTLTLSPLKTPIVTEGIPERSLKQINTIFKNSLLTPLPLGAKIANGEKTDDTLKPGSAVAVSYMLGDRNLSAVGTVTYVKGDTVLAFGHPFNGIGKTNMPMCTAYVHTIVNNELASFKLASPIKIVGAMVSDNQFTIIGDTSVKAQTIPIKITLDDITDSYKKEWDVEIVNDPLLSLDILYYYLLWPLLGVVSPNPLSADIVELKALIDTKQAGRIEQFNVFSNKNLYYSYGMPAYDFLLMFNTLMSSDYSPVDINSVNLDIKINHSKRIATIEKIIPDRFKAKPGETVNIAVTVKPDSLESTIITIPVTVPEYTTSDSMNIVIGGSTDSMLHQLFNARPTDEEGLQGQIRWNTKIKTGYNLMGIAITADPAYPYMGKIINNIPPKWHNLLRYNFSTTGMGGTNGKMTQNSYLNSMEEGTFINGFTRPVANIFEISTDYLLSGIQMVKITIDAQDKSGVGILYPANFEQPAIPLSSIVSSPLKNPQQEEQENYYSYTVAEIISTNKLAENDEVKIMNPADESARDDEEKEGDEVMEQQRETPLLRDNAPLSLEGTAAFSRGKFVGTTMTDNGKIIVAPDITGNVFSFSILASDTAEYNGNLYMVGFYSKEILLFDGKNVKRFASIEESRELVTISIDKTSGNIAVGTLVGKVYILNASGEEIAQYDLGDAVYDLIYVDGKLVAATDKAKLYLLNGGKQEVYNDKNNAYLNYLTAEDGKVYFVAHPKNRVYTYDITTGKVNIIYDSRETITELLMENGVLYIGEAKTGNILRIKDGNARKIATVKGSGVTIVNDMLYFDNSLYVISGPGGGITKISNPESETPEIITIHPIDIKNNGAESIIPTSLGSDGKNIYVLCNFPKQILTISQGTHGYYLSQVFVATDNINWGSLNLYNNGKNITKDIKAYISIDKDAAYLDNKTRIVESMKQTLVNGAIHENGKEIIFLFELSNSDIVDMVRISYQFSNRAPISILRSDLRANTLRSIYTISFAVSDPDGDKVTTCLYISKDDGEWQPVEFTENGKTVRETVLNGIAFDTTKFANGEHYRLKIVSCDKYAKPFDTKTTEAVSGYFTIDNEKPTIGTIADFDYTKSPQEFWLIKTLSAIKGGKFRINNAEWVALSPVDGYFDSTYEKAMLITPDGYPTFDKTKEFSLEIIAEDIVGNTNTLIYIVNKGIK